MDLFFHQLEPKLATCRVREISAFTSFTHRHPHHQSLDSSARVRDQGLYTRVCCHILAPSSFLSLASFWLHGQDQAPVTRCSSCSSLTRSRTTSPSSLTTWRVSWRYFGHRSTVV